MYLYLYQSENMGRPQNSSAELSAFRDRLFRRALKDYCDRKMPRPDYEALKGTPIEKGPKGKPYFADLQRDDGKSRLPVHFSVSHSGDWWGCLIADEPVGFDLEVCREKVCFDRISGRFFTEAEHDWILSMGREAFFEVWVRKEAYVKFLGTGLGEGLSSFTVIRDGKLQGEVFSEKDESRYGMVRPCCIGEGVKAAYCCGSGTPISGTVRLER